MSKDDFSIPDGFIGDEEDPRQPLFGADDKADLSRPNVVKRAWNNKWLNNPVTRTAAVTTLGWATSMVITGGLYAADGIGHALGNKEMNLVNAYDKFARHFFSDDLDVRQLEAPEQLERTLGENPAFVGVTAGTLWTGVEATRLAAKGCMKCTPAAGEALRSKFSRN